LEAFVCRLKNESPLVKPLDYEGSCSAKRAYYPFST